MPESEDYADAVVIAKRAENARERHDFLRAVALFEEALTLLRGNGHAAARTLERWCKAHCGAACAAIGDYDVGSRLFTEAERMFSETEREERTSAAGRAFTWLQAQRGELHRLRAQEELTPTRDFGAYCEQIKLAADAFRQALAREPNNPWASLHLASTATLAYWNGFSDPQWRKAIEVAGLQDRARIRELFDRGLSARPRDWWGRTFQVIYYIVEYPVDFRLDLRGQDATAQKKLEWIEDMARWWNNYELAMDLSSELETLGMLPYAAEAGRAVATAYGLTWHDALIRNLHGSESLGPKAAALLQAARERRGAYLERAAEGGHKLLRYSPEDIFGNLVTGALLRTTAADGPQQARRATAYLSTLRKLSVSQTFLTDMLRRSTVAGLEIRAGLSSEQQQEFDQLHELNGKIWSLLDTGAQKHLAALSPFERATPRAHSTEHAVLKNLLFPGLHAGLRREERKHD